MRNLNSRTAKIFVAASQAVGLATMSIGCNYQHRVGLNGTDTVQRTETSRRPFTTLADVLNARTASELPDLTEKGNFESDILLVQSYTSPSGWSFNRPLTFGDILEVPKNAKECNAIFEMLRTKADLNTVISGNSPIDGRQRGVKHTLKDYLTIEEKFNCNSSNVGMRETDFETFVLSVLPNHDLGTIIKAKNRD